MSRQSLFRKYVAVFVILVSGTLLISGLLQTAFSYEQNQAALVAVQREKAAVAAVRIEEFVAQAESHIGSAVPAPFIAARTLSPEQRRDELLRLLRQVAAVTEVSYLDADGREQVHISRVGTSALGSGVDRSSDSAYIGSRGGRTYFGPVYFRNESEPYMSIAVPESLPGRGVTVAELNLKLIWDVVSRIQVGKAGFAYVVDGSGQLLAHPDLSLVLQRRDFSLLPQIQATRRGSACCEAEPTIATDINGRQVLTARAVIDPPGWSVFVEQPLEEAFAPLYVLLARIGIVLVGGLVLSVLASLLLARRMTSPIRELQAGAARIGAGALDQRIDVRTGDELEALGAAFNQMTAQLRDSYATLERKVEERTRDLADALTRLEAQSQQLESASHHKSEFLANMSHELRTPLNAINGFSQVLLERLFGDVNARQEQYLKDILSSGRHLLSLINDILDLSKVEAGRMDLQRSSFSLPDALENGLTMVRERACRRAITLGLEVDPSIGLVDADERKVKQVVFNLLSNAVKFTPDRGCISVVARRVDGEVHIDVHDTGVGIAQGDQAVIFEEFSQVGQGALQSSEGTGLGLALARRYVELHGGRIWVASRPGEGSTFTFSLPNG